jgi:hypothetical protein
VEFIFPPSCFLYLIFFIKKFHHRSGGIGASFNGYFRLESQYYDVVIFDIGLDSSVKGASLKPVRFW